MPILRGRNDFVARTNAGHRRLRVSRLVLAAVAAVAVVGLSLHLRSPAGPGAQPLTVAEAQGDWLGASLVDVRTEQAFTLRDFQGRPVLLQPMAVW